MGKVFTFLAVGVMGIVGVLYAAPAAVTWYQTHRAQQEIAAVQVLYEADIKSADSDMADEIQAAHVERDNKIAAARSTRDVAVREIRAAYPRAQLPRQVAITDRTQ